MTYKRISVLPLAGALGAEVRGVDLTRADKEAWSEIKAAFLDRLVLTFPDQALDPKAIAKVSENFGPLGFYPFAEGLPEEPHVFAIVKEPHETKNFGEGWHSDTTYTERPPMATVLYSVEVPPYGGDTLFANMYLAYESLSDGMKTALQGLHALNSAAHRKGGGRAAGNAYQSVKLVGQDNMNLDAVHPVVRTHPETGRKALYVNPGHTDHIVGMDAAESRALLDELFAHATDDAFVYRHKWSLHDLVFWDNRCLMHIADPALPGYDRHMHRTTVEGDRPY